MKVSFSREERLMGTVITLALRPVGDTSQFGVANMPGTVFTRDQEGSAMSEKCAVWPMLAASMLATLGN